MFHFIGEIFWLPLASFATMQFPNDNGFDKGKLSVMAFLNNQLVPLNRSISQSLLAAFVKKCG